MTTEEAIRTCHMNSLPGVAAHIQKLQDAADRATPAATLDTVVQEFLGWLSADIRELHHVAVPDLADSWARYKSLAR